MVGRVTVAGKQKPVPRIKKKTGSGLARVFQTTNRKVQRRIIVKKNFGNAV